MSRTLIKLDTPELDGTSQRKSARADRMNQWSALIEESRERPIRTSRAGKLEKVLNVMVVGSSQCGHITCAEFADFRETPSPPRKWLLTKPFDQKVSHHASMTAVSVWKGVYV